MATDLQQQLLAAARAGLDASRLDQVLLRLVHGIGAVARYLETWEQAEPHLVKLAEAGLVLAGERLGDELPEPGEWRRMTNGSRLHGLAYLAALTGALGTAVRLPGSFAAAPEQVRTVGYELAGMALAMLDGDGLKHGDTEGKTDGK